MADHKAEATGIKNEKTRLYLYGIGVAVAALLVGYGIVSYEESQLWLSVAGAALGLTNVLAAVNVRNGGGGDGK